MSLLGLLLLCATALAAQSKTVLPKPPLATAPAASAAVPPLSPFTILGFVQKATLNTPGDPLSGGTLVVNDHTIVVSGNVMVNMPGALLRWAELFSLAPAPWGPNQTGLAPADVPKPFATYEVLVQGNRAISAGKDQYLAGLIFLSQQSLNSGQGFINFIDYATGELRVGGAPNDPASGARVRLNDPLGRFGRAMSPDVRFTIDENNPTVRAASGYPMCIPRVNLAAATAANPVADDPLCPQSNRPRDATSGAFKTFFQMPPPPCAYFPPLPSGAPAITPPNCTLNPSPGAPDATRQMPFEIGDYVTFRGTLVPDTSAPGCVAGASRPDPACQYISAWSVIAGIGAFTSPGVMPAYVAIDVTLMGAGGIPKPGVPQEATATARVEGFTTDPTEPVDIYGVDVDPCIATTADRYWGTQPIQQIGKFGRFRFLPVGGTFTPAVREVRAVSQTLTQGVIPASSVAHLTFANGLLAGQYDAPMTQFIFPESAEIGARIPLNFDDFPFLALDINGRGCTASLTPGSLTFSDQTVGVVSPPQIVTLANTGAGGLNIGSVFISPGYSQTNDCGTHLDIGASCKFSVTYLPASAETRSGVLRIGDTAAGSPQTVSLVGSVAAPFASWSAPAITFDDQAPGTTSPPQALTLTNTGGDALNISGVFLSPGYSQRNDCPPQLPPGAKCTFSVRFAPGAPGALAGTLRLSDNAAGQSYSVSLAGSSSDFELSPATGSSMSATVLAGQTAVYNLRVTGTDLAAATVNLSCSGLPEGARCRFVPASIVLHGSQSQSLTVRISTPSRPALDTAARGGKPPITFPLSLSLFGGVVAAGFTRKRPRKVILGIIMFCALTLSGCGGASWTHKDSAAPFIPQVTITATASNGAVHSMKLGLIIQERPKPTAPVRPQNQPVARLHEKLLHA